MEGMEKESRLSRRLLHAASGGNMRNRRADSKAVSPAHGDTRPRHRQGRIGHGLAAKLALVAVSVFVAGPSGAFISGASATSTPTITSDKADYAPGATVTLTGAGWQPGEAVHVLVTNSSAGTWSYSADVAASSTGGFTTQFKLSTSYIATYFVSATGPVSGTATTSFTDHAASLDQCRNGGVSGPFVPCANSAWVNGNAGSSDSHWTEDEFIPYRAEVSGITASGTVHTLELEYDTVVGGLHAIDYLGSFDATETTSSEGNELHANKSDPCGDVLPGCNPAAPTSSLPLPPISPQGLTNCVGVSTGTPPTPITGADSGRFMKIWGPLGTAITAMKYEPETNKGGGTCSRIIKVTFEVGGSEPTNTVVLAWGGHIARGPGFNGWGAGKGAGSVNGSSYHMAFVSGSGHGLDGESQGSQDRSLSAGAVIPASTITIIKKAVGGNGTFGYTTTGGGGLEPSFTITTIGGEGKKINPGINPGSYTVNESSLPTGWNFTSLECATEGGATFEKSGAKASITIPVTGGATVTCTYTNTKKVKPEISTTIHNAADKSEVTGALALGSSVYDTASVTSSNEPTFKPTGTVTFLFYESGDCSGTPAEQTGVALGKESATHGPLGAGSYSFKAKYVAGSDPNFNGATSSCEPLTINKATPSISTTVEDKNGSTIDNTHPAAVGTEVHDTASLTGTTGFSLAEGATVTYHFYTNNNCEGTPTNETVTVAANGSVPDSAAQTLGAGSYSYSATYNPNTNTNYKSATSAIEPFRVVQKSLVTDTSLCTFNEEPSMGASTFRLIYTPSSPGSKLSASNPGQFYYNVFDNAPTGKITFTLPYPFVTQGATPIHVYSSVTMVTKEGKTCLIPGPEVAGSKSTVTLASYGSGGFGSTATVTVTFSSPSGFAYANIHVEYGLKGTTGWTKGGISGNDAISGLEPPLPTIHDGQAYTFSETDGSPDSQVAHSTNAFKKDPGIGGLVQRANLELVPNVPLGIYDSTGKLVYSTATDRDGWYYWEYKYTGKATSFTVKLGAPYAGKQQTVWIKSNGYALANFTGL